MAKFGTSKKTQANATGAIVSVRGRREPGTHTLRGFGDEFSPTLSRFAMQPFATFGETATGWRTPRVDLCEDDKSYEVEIELPGVRKEDLEVTVIDGRLEIQCEPNMERDDEERMYRLREIGHRSFYRSVPLPRDADEENVEATLEDGCLVVEILKTDEENARGTRIDVR